MKGHGWCLKAGRKRRKRQGDEDIEGKRRLSNEKQGQEKYNLDAFLFLYCKVCFYERQSIQNILVLCEHKQLIRMRATKSTEEQMDDQRKKKKIMMRCRLPTTSMEDEGVFPHLIIGMQGRRGDLGCCVPELWECHLTPRQQVPHAHAFDGCLPKHTLYST